MEVIVVVRVVKEAVKLLTALRAVQAVRVAEVGRPQGAGHQWPLPKSSVVRILGIACASPTPKVFALGTSTRSVAS